MKRMLATRAPQVLAGLLGAAAFVAAAAAPVPDLSPHPAVATQPRLLDDGSDLPFDPSLAAVSCPIERGPVKSGSDADRYRVSTSSLTTSISYLASRPKPSSYPRNNRIAPTELHTWTLNSVRLTQYKLESDGDLHLVLKDSVGRQMIAEVPYGPCVPTSSRWKSAIATARSTFLHALPATTTWRYSRRLIDLHGLGMFDVLHGQTGVARNGIELHPVTYIHLH